MAEVDVYAYTFNRAPHAGHIMFYLAHPYRLSLGSYEVHGRGCADWCKVAGRFADIEAKLEKLEAMTNGIRRCL